MRNVICILIIIVLLTGCSRPKRTVSDGEDVQTVDAVSTDVVKLDSITAPEFTERFVTMKFGDAVFDVAWGYSETDAVMSAESGYPGFDRPMLIIIPECKEIVIGEKVTLCTNWGKYFYVVNNKCAAVLDDSGENIISKTTREPLIRFFAIEESLFLFDRNSGTSYSCSFLTGTKIII